MCDDAPTSVFLERKRLAMESWKGHLHVGCICVFILKLQIIFLLKSAFTENIKKNDGLGPIKDLQRRVCIINKTTGE